MMKKIWKLNASDVGIFLITGAGDADPKGAHPGKPKRFLQVRLVHAATGIEVQNSSPHTAMNKPEAAKLKNAIVNELWLELERLVAKHLRIPGR